MKKLFFAIAILLTTSAYAQSQLNELSFEDCENSSVFREIKNNTKILKYTSANGAILTLGDTLVIGVPSGSITSTTAVGAGNSVGAAKARSRTQSSFTTIIMGRPAGFGSIMNAMAGEAPENASANMQGEIVVISEMKVSHKGSNKKQIALTIFSGMITHSFTTYFLN